MLSDKELVVYAAVGMSGVCFLIFLYQVVLKKDDPAKTQVKTAASKMSLRADSLTPTVPELTALLDSFAKVVDSFSKAGPALTSISASILFLLIAAIASGAFQGGSKDDDSKKTEINRPGVAMLTSSPAYKCG